MNIAERIREAQLQAQRVTHASPTTLYLGNAEYIKLTQHLKLPPCLPEERLTFLGMLVFRVDATSYLKATP